MTDLAVCSIIKRKVSNAILQNNDSSLFIVPDASDLHKFCEQHLNKVGDST